MAVVLAGCVLLVAVSVECSRVEDRVVGLCSEGVACDAQEVLRDFGIVRSLGEGATRGEEG
jgi:hypothetical protein